MEILNDRFDKLDYESAKKDVIPFIKNIKSLEIWSRDFFKAITANIRCD